MFGPQIDMEYTELRPGFNNCNKDQRILYFTSALETVTKTIAILKKVYVLWNQIKYIKYQTWTLHSDFPPDVTFFSHIYHIDTWYLMLTLLLFLHSILFEIGRNLCMCVLKTNMSTKILVLDICLFYVHSTTSQNLSGRKLAS